MKYQFDGGKSNNVHEFEGGGRREKATVNYSDIPPLAIRRIASVFSEGIEKYGPHTWQKLPWNDTYDHLMEHLIQYQEGDRSVDHLAKVCWGLITQMWRDENEARTSADNSMSATIEHGLWEADYQATPVTSIPYTTYVDKMQELSAIALRFSVSAYKNPDLAVVQARNRALSELIDFEREHPL